MGNNGNGNEYGIGGCHGFDLMEGRVNLEEGCLVAVTDSRTLFGELIIKLVNDGKLELLNSIE